METLPMPLVDLREYRSIHDLLTILVITEAALNIVFFVAIVIAQETVCCVPREKLFGVRKFVLFLSTVP